MKRLFIIGFLLYILPSFGQSTKTEEKMPAPQKGYVLHAIVINGDTLPIVYLSQVNIVTERVFKNKRQAEKYNKLKRDVKKVYPYAIIAGAKLREYNSSLSRIHNEIQRKAFMKKAEGELISHFEKDMRKLTFTQGKILIKLIDRETEKTSFQIVKEMRGSVSAFMWQSVARIFGSNLKSEFDSKGDDRMIEDIIGMIESGQI